MEVKNSRRLKGSVRASLAMREVLVSSVQATLFVIEAMIQLSWEEQAESLGLVSTGSCLK